MKILVLMPCDERRVYYASKIFKKLSPEMKEITFIMAMFIDFLMQTKVESNPASALFYSILSAEKLYEAAKKDDLIIFGNINKDYEFDAVFSFQDAEQTLPYDDKFITLIQEKVKDEESLMKYINNLYGAEDVKLKLRDCTASANFLTDDIKTDPKLDEIKEKYKDKLNFKEGD